MLSRASLVVVAKKRPIRTSARCGHTVRVLAVSDDWPDGSKTVQGDVVTVKAGYARNFLVPRKLAVYATRANFEKYGVVDPVLAKEVEKADKTTTCSTEQQAADLLRRYLANKKVRSIFAREVSQHVHS